MVKEPYELVATAELKFHLFNLSHTNIRDSS